MIILLRPSETLIILLKYFYYLKKVNNSKIIDCKQVYIYKIHNYYIISEYVYKSVFYYFREKTAAI